MAWLVVDKNGTEKIFNLKPNRGQNQPDIDKSIAEKELDDDIWYSTCYDVDKDGYLLFDPDLDCTTGVELPKGTIKTLIGRELTWEDEPVRYEKMDKKVDEDLIAKCVAPGFIRIFYKDRIPRPNSDMMETRNVILSVDDFAEISEGTEVVDYNRPDFDSKYTILSLRDGRKFYIEGQVSEYILKAMIDAKNTKRTI